jgi:hypothetical protein
VKLSGHPSILLNHRECSPLGVNKGVNVTPRGQISPLGARGEVKNGPQDSSKMWLSITYTETAVFVYCIPIQRFLCSWLLFRSCLTWLNWLSFLCCDLLEVCQKHPEKDWSNHLPTYMVKQVCKAHACMRMYLNTDLTKHFKCHSHTDTYICIYLYLGTFLH